MSNCAQNDYSVQSYEVKSLCLPHNKTRQNVQTRLTLNMPLDTKIILVRASSKIVSTSSLRNDSNAICFTFFSKSLLTKCNYEEKFLGPIAASGGSSIRHVSNGIRHHFQSFGIIHITVLRPCWLR